MANEPFTPNETIATAVADITAQLQETHPPAAMQIRRIVEQVGVAAAYDFLQQTLAIEAQGGMLTADKQRRRTPGGVYFYLIRGQVTPDIRRKLWPRPWTKRDKDRPPAPPETRRPFGRAHVEADRPQNATAPKKGKAATGQPLPWEERLPLGQQALQAQGAATTVKITLVGRPAKTIARPDVVLLTLAAPKPPALPKGLPVLPETAVTVYLVYIARKQWDKVAAALEDPEDRLVIEGYPFFDGKLNVIGVLTQNVTTVLQQRARKLASAAGC